MGDELTTTEILMKLKLLKLKYHHQNGTSEIYKTTTQVRDEIHDESSDEYDEDSSQLQTTIQQCIREAIDSNEMTDPSRHPSSPKAPSRSISCTNMSPLAPRLSRKQEPDASSQSLSTGVDQNGGPLAAKAAAGRIKALAKPKSFAAAARLNLNLQIGPATPTFGASSRSHSASRPATSPTYYNPGSSSAHASLSPLARAELSLAILNVTPLVNEKDLLTYFSRYGEVGSVYISRQQLRQHAFINFVRYYSSETPLKDSVHVINGHPCKVRMAYEQDTVKQRKCEVVKKTKNLMLSGNLADIQTIAIRKHFEKFGAIDDISRCFNPVTKKYKNFAFVIFKGTKAVDAAAANIDHIIDGQTIYVKRNKEFSQ